MSIFLQKKLKKRLFNIKFLMILTALIFWFSVNLYSNLDGIAGKTSTTSSGCDCHSNSSSSATTVTNTSGSGSYVFTPGSTNSFTVTIAHATKPECGVNIAVKTTQTGNTSAGTLSPGSGLKMVGSEIVHMSPITMSGGQATVTFTWTAPMTPGTYYLRAIGNADNNNNSEDNGDIWNWMTVQPLTVSPSASVSVTAPNGGESWCSGTLHNITWTSTGVTTVKIEASTDGGSTYSSLATAVTASAGTWAWNIPSGQQAGSQYKIKITDESNATVNDASNANFTIAQGVSITVQPQPTTVCSNSSAQFSVTASGNGLTYQWRKGGSNINGATASSYTINSTTSSDAGSYDCVINSSCGTPVTSSAATLTVNVSPSITNQPQSQTICQNASVNFSVTATGTDLTYQWKKDGANISGATASTYSISSVQAADAGQYSVEVSGICTPPATSNPATLTVGDVPSITNQPTTQTVCQNESVNFTVTATGTDLTYQWKKNGVNINGATAATYSISSVQTSDEGQYTVVVSGLCTPSSTSEIAGLTVNAAASITTQPSAVEVCTGKPATFQVVAAGGNNLTYKWFKNDVEIPNSNSPTYSINTVSISDAGNYNVVVSNTCNPPAASNKVQLTVNDIPVIIGQPEAISVVEGSTATLSITANSATSYQWRKNNTNISSGTSAMLIINNIQLADSGTYDCVVSNNCGDVTSQAAILTVQSAGAGPLLTVNCTKVDFGKIIVNKNKDSLMTSMISNTGSQKLDVEQMSVSGTDNTQFTIIGNPAPFSLQPNETKNITLSFSPASGGTKAATLKFISNSKQDNNVYLTGFGGIISVTASKSSLNFDSINTNSSLNNSFTLNNTGNMDAHVQNMEITGSNATFFKIVSTSQSNNFKIDSGSSKEVVVAFNPLLAILANAELNIQVENITENIQVELSGKGILLGIDENVKAFSNILTYPNPSSGSVNISFDTKNGSVFKLSIFDILGNEIRTFDNQNSSTGKNLIKWDGTDNNGKICDSGTYICICKTNDWIKTFQINLIK